MADAAAQDILARGRRQPPLKDLSWAHDWVQHAKESLARAVYIRLLERRVGKDAAARARHDEDESRFPGLPALLAELETYERQRAKYPALSAVYPRLLQAAFP